MRDAHLHGAQSSTSGCLTIWPRFAEAGRSISMDMPCIVLFGRPPPSVTPPSSPVSVGNTTKEPSRPTKRRALQLLLCAGSDAHRQSMEPTVPLVEASSSSIRWQRLSTLTEMGRRMTSPQRPGKKICWYMLRSRLNKSRKGTAREKNNRTGCC